MPTLLQMVALNDPDTPGHVLGLIGAGARHENDRARLLAHPNTPAHLTEGVTLGLGAAVDAALRSAALTPATQSRVLAAATDEALSSMTQRVWSYPRAVIDTLAARIHSGRGTAVAAAVLMDHAWVDSATHLAALRVAVTDLETVAAHRGLAGVKGLSGAARRHPQHLRELTKLCTDPDMTALLAALADAHDQGRDVLSEHHAATSARLATATGPHAIDLLSSAPNEQNAHRLLQQRGLRANAANAILAQNALRETPVWWAAWACQYGRTYDYDADAGAAASALADVTLVDAAYGTQPAVVASTSIDIPLDADPDVLRAAHDALHRVVTSGPSRGEWDQVEVVEHAARLLAHPATPAHLLPDLRSLLRALLGGVEDKHMVPQHPARLLAEHDDMAAVLTGTPVARLHEACKEDDAFRDSLAHHAAPLLRPTWADPDATRAVFALAPTFPGTLPQLLATSATITS